MIWLLLLFPSLGFSKPLWRIPHSIGMEIGSSIPKQQSTTLFGSYSRSNNDAISLALTKSVGEEIGVRFFSISYSTNPLRDWSQLFSFSTQQTDHSFIRRQFDYSLSYSSQSWLGEFGLGGQTLALQSAGEEGYYRFWDPQFTVALSYFYQQWSFTWRSHWVDYRRDMTKINEEYAVLVLSEESINLVSGVYERNNLFSIDWATDRYSLGVSLSQTDFPSDHSQTRQFELQFGYTMAKYFFSLKFGRHLGEEVKYSSVSISRQF